jgi:hypothetical protein
VGETGEVGAGANIFPLRVHRSHMYSTLIKKKIKCSSSIRKFRMEQLPSHTVYEEGLPNMYIYEEMRIYLTIINEEAVSHE